MIEPDCPRFVLAHLTLALYQSQVDAKTVDAKVCKMMI